MWCPSSKEHAGRKTSAYYQPRFDFMSIGGEGVNGKKQNLGWQKAHQRAWGASNKELPYW